MREYREHETCKRSNPHYGTVIFTCVFMGCFVLVLWLMGAK